MTSRVFPYMTLDGHIDGRIYDRVFSVKYSNRGH